MLNNNQIAMQIIAAVGGQGNIQSVAHCATRLRIMVQDESKINKEEVENIDKVKGAFFNSGQYQIILGTGTVNKIYEEVIKLGVSGSSKQEMKDSSKKQGNVFQRAIRIFGDVFVSIIPVLVATGLFMGLRGLLTQELILNFFGMTPDAIDPNFLLFTQILTDTAFAFLPVLVCWSTFKTFGGSQVVGIVVGLMLVSPNLPNAYGVASGAEMPLEIFGFIPIVGYQGSVLPAFIAGLLGAKLEIGLRKRVPETLDLLLTPFLSILIMMILSLCVIGPVFHSVESIVLYFAEWLLGLPLGLSGLVIGGLNQLIVVTGIHHIFNFLEVQLLANTGANAFNAIITCSIVAQGGACLAVGLKTKNKKLKALALPSSFSAFLGITEPAIFGVNLRFVKPFIMGLIGGAAGGFIAALFGIAGTGMSVTGIPGALLYLDGQILMYLVINFVSVAVAFGLTWMFGYKDETSIETQNVANSQEVTIIHQCIKGEVMDLEEVPDETFAKKMLGEGIAVNPSEGKLYAPFDGTVEMLFPTKHAIGLTSNTGVSILVHIGLDTVELKGKYFDSKVQVGDVFIKGDLLMEFDIEQIKKEGYQVITPIIVTDSSEYIVSKTDHDKQLLEVKMQA